MSSLTIHQTIIPAARNIKDYEYLLTSSSKLIILLDCHVSQVQALLKLGRQHDKHIILHADLVQGLKHDEHGTQFLCQVGQPYGLISTHSVVISTAKKRGLKSIQRVFLLDSHSLNSTYKMLKTSQPDYIEVLPGVMPKIVQEVREATHIPILAGGFIRTMEDVEVILQSGATAITTSHRPLWKEAHI